MQSIIFALLLFSASSVADDNSQAPDQKSSEKLCATPQAAMSAVLSSGHKRTACFEPHSAYASHELIVIGEHLVKVLKAQNVEIELKKIPNEPDYRDPHTKQERYFFIRDSQPVYLEKSEGRWIFTDDVIENINVHTKDALHFNVKRVYEFLPAGFLQDFFGIPGFNFAQILLFIALLFIAFILRMGIASFIAWQLHFVLGHLHFDEDAKVLRRTGKSLGSLVIAGLLSIIVPGLDLDVHLTHYLILGVRFFAGAAAVFFACHVIDIATHFIYRRAQKTESKMDDQLVPMLGRVIKVVTIIIGGIFILQNLDVDVTSLLAGVTIGGLAFSFAAKDAVANFFGSITIFSEKSFSVGDMIKIHDVQGLVEFIGFRSTHIRTLTDSLVSVPNSKFTDEIVENFTARKYRFTNAELSVAHETTPEQIEEFCNGIRLIITAHPLTRKDLLQAYFAGYTETSLKIMINFYTPVKTLTEELRIRHEIYLAIRRLADKIAIQFSTPQNVTNIYADALAGGTSSQKS